MSLQQAMIYTTSCFLPSVNRGMLILLFCTIFLAAKAQTAADTVVQKDIVELWFKKKPLLKDPAQPKVPDTLKTNKWYPSFLPIVGYNPALGFVFGAGVSAGAYLGPRATTHISSILFNVTYTTKNQLNFNARSNVYLKDDAWILQGDLRYLIFQQDTHGLGIDFAGSKDGSQGKQAMRFNYLRFYQTVYRSLGQRWYVGAGFQLDGHSAIKEENADTVGGKLTAHASYQKTNNLPLDKYHSLGLTIGALYDNRDNAIAPWGGQYFQVQFRVNPGFLSTSANTNLFADYRNYKAFKGRNATPSVLAFWTWTQIKTSGRLPYLGLPAISWDTYNRSGRGYVQGRIRGESIWYGETEYRFPISPNGLLGGVGFFNLTSAADQAKGQKLFQSFAPGYGIGLRVKMNKKTRTNIGIDYGRGLNGNGAIYFNLQEAF